MDLRYYHFINQAFEKTGHGFCEGAGSYPRETDLQLCLRQGCCVSNFKNSPLHSFSLSLSLFLSISHSKFSLDRHERESAEKLVFYWPIEYNISKIIVYHTLYVMSPTSWLYLCSENNSSRGGEGAGWCYPPPRKRIFPVLAFVFWFGTVW